MQPIIVLLRLEDTPDEVNTKSSTRRAIGCCHEQLRTGRHISGTAIEWVALRYKTTVMLETRWVTISGRHDKQNTKGYTTLGHIDEAI